VLRFVATKGFGSPSFVSVGQYRITRHPRKHGRSVYRVHVLVDPDEWKFRKLPGEHRSMKVATEAASKHAAENGDTQARTLRSLVEELSSRVAQLEAERKAKR